MRASEVAAVAAARTRGRGDKVLCDQAATQEMRRRLSRISMRGTVRIGEGELDGCDSTSMLRRGEQIGLGWENGYEDLNFPKVDIAVDPLEGTNLCARNESNAICVAAFTEDGGIISVPELYMDKIVVGPDAKGLIDIEAPIEHNLKQIAKGLRRGVDDLTIMVLDRPRHRKLIDEIRQAGADVALINDGDLSAGLLCGLAGSGIAAAWGIGGGPEGVLVAALMQVLGGEIQGKFVTKDNLVDENDREGIPEDVIEQLRQSGIKNPTGVLRTEDLVTSHEVVFTAAAVTNSELLKGVRFFGHNEDGKGERVQSLMMMSSNGSRIVRRSDTTEVTNLPSFVFRIDRD